MRLKQPKVAPDWYGTTYIGVEGYWKVNIRSIGGIIRTLRYEVYLGGSFIKYTYFNREDAIQKGIDLYNEHVAELLELIVDPEVTSPECAYPEGTLGSYIQDAQHKVTQN